MERVQKVLEKFGLSENEIKVYLACLKHEDMSPFKISKLTKIPRTTIYDILMGLALKNLVELEQSDGFTKQQTRVRTKNPSELRKTLRKKREDLKLLEWDLLEILPELKGDYYKKTTNADFKFYPGVEGAKKVYFGLDQKRGDYDEIAWTYLMRVDSFGKEFVDRDTDKIIKNVAKTGKKVREIVPLNQFSRDILVYTYGRSPGFLDTWEYRYIDHELFQLYLRLAISGTRVRMTCAEDDEIWGIVINSKLLSKSIQSIFEMTWLMATPVTEEVLKGWEKDSYLIS